MILRAAEPPAARPRHRRKVDGGWWPRCNLMLILQCFLRPTVRFRAVGFFLGTSAISERPKKEGQTVAFE